MKPGTARETLAMQVVDDAMASPQPAAPRRATRPRHASARDCSEPVEVFISHRSEHFDTEIAELLERELRARGLQAFLDTRDLHAGDSYIRPILSAIRCSRVVVVLFGAKPTSWVHFESACAFFDEKLLPVAISKHDVPKPYDRIQHDCVSKDGHEIDMLAIERVADEVCRRVLGGVRGGAATRRWQRGNAWFFSGLPIVFAAAFAVVLFGLGELGEHLRHLHVVLGAVLLGGQFFLALAFARTVAGPSFSEREAGFATTERLFGVWALFACVQPLLGLWLTRGTVAGWVWFSLVLYLLGLLLTGGGYVAARSARELDRRHESPRVVAARNMLANLLFLAGFVAMVAVINVMLAKHVPWFELGAVPPTVETASMP